LFNSYLFTVVHVLFAGNAGRVLATGGASKNQKILQVCIPIASSLLIVTTDTYMAAVDRNQWLGCLQLCIIDTLMFPFAPAHTSLPF